ncbi:hypothetical protein QYM36_005727 [Artemia franciscana]|uniref:Reverse transcriptase RNase H-like domain-containing protein n=1 Tax=Artemia franciscana TaxID=6661 RepID=A0AA88HWN8_ARTSF|nr:hypothetical protein QYM36_005727 [Artemia franciscana]
MIRDQLVFGVKQDKIRERLLSEGAGLTLARSIATCRAAEAIQVQLMIMSNQEHSKVHVKQEIDVVTRPTSNILTSYTGESLKVAGTCQLEVQNKNRDPQIHKFCEVDTDKRPILSRQTSVSLNLIKFIYNIEQTPVASTTDEILAEYKNVFKAIGKMPGKCKIHLKPGVIPSVQPPRKVPLVIQDRLKNELERQVSLGIIEKATEPTEWVNSMVVVQKPNDDIWIGLDPVVFNKWIQRPHYPIPTFDDIANKCHGAQNMFKLDARNGYWSMVLDDASLELTTFNTIFGRFKWRRYPFGIISAQDEYQCRMEEAFEGLGLGLIVDDIAGVGTSKEDHDMQLKAVLQRAREKGVKFIRHKFVFNATAIPYFGHLLNTEGVKPDPNKTKAIAEILEPRNKEELQTLLRMLNYLSRYIPSLSSLNQPLRELGKAKDFVWTKKHSDACQTIRKSLSKHLSYFDTHCQEVEKIVNASQHGLGAQLLVKDETVAFGSRSLSDTEQIYSQIEKELLSIVFACKHFHQYIFGRKVSVITDHKPLENILRKPISNAPPRLQRMMLAIQPYDLRFTYRPGQEIPVADSLSRLHMENTDPEEDLQAELHGHNVMKHIPIKDQMVQSIADSTKYDPKMQVLAKTIKIG